MKLILTYLAIINAVACVLMLADKICAIKKCWRIPERVLLGCAAIGGSLGAWIAMYVFRHKTKHKRFSLGIPLFFLIHVALILFYLNR